MGEFIKLISDAGDNPRFAVADAKQLLKLGGKSTAAEMIEEAGGSVTKTGPSKRINYVIVGDRGNAAWAFGSYGTKVKSMPWN